MRAIDFRVLHGVQVRQRTATYVCFVLPDQRHVVEVYQSELSVKCYVREDNSNKERLSFPIIKAKAGNWEDLVQGFCEKAVIHFPAQVRSKEGHRREATIRAMSRHFR